MSLHFFRSAFFKFSVIMTPFEFYKLRNVKTFHACNLRTFKELLTFTLLYYVTYQSETDRHLIIREMINRVFRFRDQLEQINHNLEDCFLTAKSVYDEFGQSVKDFETECRNTISILD